MIFFAVFAAAAVRSVSKPFTGRRPKLIFAMLIITLVVGLRFEVGGDWYNYLDIFEKIKRGDLLQAITQTDAGYGLANWIAGELRWGIWFPNLVCAAIFTWGLVAFARQQPVPLLALVASMYLIVLIGMGFTRQSAALGFVMLAIAQYSRGATWRMVASLALATAFHYSALFVIPLMGLAVARRGVLVTGMVVLLVAVVALQFAGVFQQRYEFYATGSLVSGGALPRIAMTVLAALVFLAFRRSFTSDPAQVRLWSIFSLTSFFLVVLLFFEFPSIADRLGHYLTPLQVFVLSRLPFAFGSPTRPSMFLVVAVIAYSLIVEVGWLTLGRWGHAWLPYQNYLLDPGPERSRRSRSG